jgi:hypothetical protein
MMVRRLLFLLLIGFAGTLTPAALASPPDQTWIAGVYDDADYDDVVLAIIGSTASCGQRAPDHSLVRRVVVAFVSPTHDDYVPTPSLAARHTRAPPTS